MHAKYTDVQRLQLTCTQAAAHIRYAVSPRNNLFDHAHAFQCSKFLARDQRTSSLRAPDKVKKTGSVTTDLDSLQKNGREQFDAVLLDRLNKLTALQRRKNQHWVPRYRGTIPRNSLCEACCEVLQSLKEQDQQEFEVKRLLYLVRRAGRRVLKGPRCCARCARIPNCGGFCGALPSLKEQDQQEFEVKRLLYLVGRADNRVPKRPRCRGTIRRISHCVACCEDLPTRSANELRVFEQKMEEHY
mmetsp:Transcript_39093/g.103825  ORF Transcript_39093/g.103825 Transcript_39093/m.103825 type:complete len:244 (-) Transcript_39093:908-1639(-)